MCARSHTRTRRHPCTRTRTLRVPGKAPRGLSDIGEGFALTPCGSIRGTLVAFGAPTRPPVFPQLCLDSCITSLLSAPCPLGPAGLKNVLICPSWGLCPIAATPAGMGLPLLWPLHTRPVWAAGCSAHRPRPASCSQRSHCREAGGTGRRGTVPKPDTSRRVPGKDTCQDGIFRAALLLLVLLHEDPGCLAAQTGLTSTQTATEGAGPPVPERLRGPGTCRGQCCGDGEGPESARREFLFCEFFCNPRGHPVSGHRTHVWPPLPQGPRPRGRGQRGDLRLLGGAHGPAPLPLAQQRRPRPRDRPHVHPTRRTDGGPQAGPARERGADPRLRSRPSAPHTSLRTGPASPAPAWGPHVCPLPGVTARDRGLHGRPPAKGPVDRGARSGGPPAPSVCRGRGGSPARWPPRPHGHLTVSRLCLSQAGCVQTSGRCWGDPAPAGRQCPWGPVPTAWTPPAAPARGRQVPGPPGADAAWTWGAPRRAGAVLRGALRPLWPPVPRWDAPHAATPLPLGPRQSLRPPKVRCRGAAVQTPPRVGHLTACRGWNPPSLRESHRLLGDRGATTASGPGVPPGRDLRPSFGNLVTGQRGVPPRCGRLPRPSLLPLSLGRSVTCVHPGHGHPPPAPRALRTAPLRGDGPLGSVAFEKAGGETSAVGHGPPGPVHRREASGTRTALCGRLHRRLQNFPTFPN